MATIINDPSHTFNEYLLIPGYSSQRMHPRGHLPQDPARQFRRGETPAITMNIPMVSANCSPSPANRLAVALAREGGVSFIYGSQSIADEAAMVGRAKNDKAGLRPQRLQPARRCHARRLLALKEQSGHSTMAVCRGRQPGRQARRHRDEPGQPRLPHDAGHRVSSFMTPAQQAHLRQREGTTLKEANDIIWDHKLNALPIVDEQDHLCYFVFRKDYDEPQAESQRAARRQQALRRRAGINSRDYAERVPALVDSGADVLCIDSSEAFRLAEVHARLGPGSTTGTPVKSAPGTWWMRLGSASSPSAARTSSRSASAAGASASPARRRHRPRAGHRAHRRVRRARPLLRARPASTSPSAPTAVIVYEPPYHARPRHGADFVMLGRYFARFRTRSPTNKVSIAGPITRNTGARALPARATGSATTSAATRS